MLNIVKKLNKKLFTQTETTLGSEIIRLSTAIGQLGDEVLIMRENKERDNHQLLYDLIHVQYNISKLYSKLRFGNNLIVDDAYNRILQNNYASISKEYNKIDTVWLYFRILSSLGEMIGKFGIRTQPIEYQYLVKDLAKLQGYLMVYILRVAETMRLTIKDIDEKIENFHTVTKAVTSKENKEQTEKPIINSDVILEEKPKKNKAKKEEPIKEEKKNQKDKKPNPNTAKPALPDQNEIKNILSRLLPKDDSQKVEPVDEATKRRILNGEL